MEESVSRWYASARWCELHPTLEKKVVIECYKSWKLAWCRLFSPCAISHYLHVIPVCQSPLCSPLHPTTNYNPLSQLLPVLLRLPSFFFPFTNFLLLLSTTFPSQQRSFCLVYTWCSTVLQHKKTKHSPFPIKPWLVPDTSDWETERASVSKARDGQGRLSQKATQRHKSASSWQLTLCAWRHDNLSWQSAKARPWSDPSLPGIKAGSHPRASATMPHNSYTNSPEGGNKSPTGMTIAAWLTQLYKNSYTCTKST